MLSRSASGRSDDRDRSAQRHRIRRYWQGAYSVIRDRIAAHEQQGRPGEE